MIYKDFVQVNDIDAQIMSLHRQLHVLYDKRSALLFSRTPSEQIVTSTIEPTKPTRAVRTTHDIYDSLKQTWAQYGVEVPKYAALKPKLHAAQTLVYNLHSDEKLYGHVHFLLIPPKASLMKAIVSASAPAIDSGSLLDLPVKFKTTWQCGLVFDSAARQEIRDYQTFERPTDYAIKGFDTLQMSAQALVAAYLQGLTLADDNSWTALPADIVSTIEVPTAQMIDDTLTFSVDDSGGLLGSNYCYPLIMVST